MFTGSAYSKMAGINQQSSSRTRWAKMQKTELSLAQMLDLLCKCKQAEGKSIHTIDWYRQCVGAYGHWLVQQDISPTLEHFTLELVRSYIVNLQQRPAFEEHPSVPVQARKLSDHTINSAARALRAFSNWLFSEQYTKEPVLARLQMPRMSKKIQDILTPEEIGAVIGSLNPRTEIGARDQAAFLLLLDTGMRAGELCNLRLSDLHLDQGYATVFGKGKKERPVKVGSRAAKALRFYMLHWRHPGMPHLDQVFLTCRGGVYRADDVSAPGPGEPLSVDALDGIIKRMGVRSGVPRLYAHLLRHTFACMYLMRHRDPFALKSLLGHTTLAMTNHYCEAVQQMDVIRADSVSIIDGLDLRALDVNRRGRPAKNARKRT